MTPGDQNYRNALQEMRNVDLAGEIAAVLGKMASKVVTVEKTQASETQQIAALHARLSVVEGVVQTLLGLITKALAPK